MKKAAIITGASSGIGAATAIEFSNQGYFVFLAARNEERLLETAMKCKSGSSILKLDLSNENSIQKYSNHIFERTDVKTEVLVNCSGIFQTESVAADNISNYRALFETNFFGTVLWTQKLLSYFIKNKSGSIVNISSTLGLKTTPFTAAYSASKSALNSWTINLALELGPHNIRANAICPGIVDTPIHNFHSEEKEKKEKILENLNSLQPLNRIGQPQEIAKLIYFIASDQSSWITGALIPIDGGINIK
jgi:NAD(P)-dependent dehydrogenase (short-subunit alcohol dehydrogenase family)